jgi:hypothetical protein
MIAKINLAKTIRLFAICLLILCPQMFVIAGEVTLENDSLKVSFDSNSGALTGLEAKGSNWTVERRPELGVSFRLFAPLPNRRYNPVLGQKQHAASVEKISDNEVRLQWKDLVSENGGVLPIVLTADVTLTSDGLVFNAALENNSPLTVETIEYPYLGDLNPPARDALMAAYTMQKGSLLADELYPHFRNEKGYWGVNYPTKMLEPQGSHFCLIQAPGEGLSVATGNESPYRVQYIFEQYPGLLSASGLVPPGDEISGHPVFLQFRVCHFVFAHGNSTVKLNPVVLHFYTGGAQNGANLNLPKNH